jgi:hypothetical protein
MAKDMQTQNPEQPKPEPKREEILHALLNTVVVLPGIGNHQTLTIEDEHSPVEKLGAHPLGLAIHLKARSPNAYFVIPWANVAVLKMGVR